MTQKKIILVTGATGAQGGSVAKALLKKGNFAVRILTRHASSPKALQLQSLGAEVVEGDLNNTNSLQAAMKDCYGVFGITNFWEHFQNEYSLGKNLIDAVAANNIKHFVLHTLPDYNALSSGQFPTPHCDMKAALKRYSNQLHLPATYVEVAFYYENFLSFFPPQPDQFGIFQFGFPQGHTKLAAVSVEDVGPIVSATFNEPEKYIGRTVGVVGADKTCHEYADAMTRILEVPVHYNYVPHELYKSFGFPGAEELANMFEVQRLYILERQKDLEESYQINPRMQTFESWLAKNKEQFLAQFEKLLVAETIY